MKTTNKTNEGINPKALPDLLEACKMVLNKWHAKASNFLKEEPEYLEKIRQAITKAEEK